MANPNTPDLKAAFRQLRKEGMFAKMNFMCCSSCASAAIPEDKEQYCFFHMQDNESRKKGKPFYLSYGASDWDKAAEVGKRVCEVLAEHNVTTEWEGTSDKRVLVKNY